MSHQYKAVAAILKNTISSINEILTDPADEMHRIRITGDLQRSTDQLLLLTGSGDLETGQGAVLGPAKTIGGKPIGKVRKFTADDMIPADDKVNSLRKAIEAAVKYFGPEANAEGILANIPELTIRGVAKKAGLPYKKDEVNTITVEFIEQIKESLAAAGIKGEAATGPQVDDDDIDDEEIEAAIGNLAEAVNETPASVTTTDDTKPSDILSKERFEGLIANLKEHQAAEESSPQNEPATQAEPPKEQPKVEEPKQETKTEPKKKTGK